MTELLRQSNMLLISQPFRAFAYNGQHSYRRSDPFFGAIASDIYWNGDGTLCLKRYVATPTITLL